MQAMYNLSLLLETRIPRVRTRNTYTVTQWNNPFELYDLESKYRYHHIYHIIIL